MSLRARRATAIADRWWALAMLIWQGDHNPARVAALRKIERDYPYSAWGPAFEELIAP